MNSSLFQRQTEIIESCRKNILKYINLFSSDGEDDIDIEILNIDDQNKTQHNTQQSYNDSS